MATVSRTAKTIAAGSNKLESIQRVAGLQRIDVRLVESEAVKFAISNLYQHGPDVVVLITFMGQANLKLLSGKKLFRCDLSRNTSAISDISYQMQVTESIAMPHSLVATPTFAIEAHGLCKPSPIF